MDNFVKKFPFLISQFSIWIFYSANHSKHQPNKRNHFIFRTTQKIIVSARLRLKLFAGAYVKKKLISTKFSIFHNKLDCRQFPFTTMEDYTTHGRRCDEEKIAICLRIFSSLAILLRSYWTSVNRIRWNISRRTFLSHRNYMMSWMKSFLKVSIHKEKFISISMTMMTTALMMMVMITRKRKLVRQFSLDTAAVGTYRIEIQHHLITFHYMLRTIKLSLQMWQELSDIEWVKGIKKLFFELFSTLFEYIYDSTHLSRLIHVWGNETRNSMDFDDNQ